MFEQLERNNNVTFHLAEKQLTLMSSSLKDMLKPIQELEKDQESIDNAINKINHKLIHIENAADKEIRALEISISINSVLEVMALKLEEILVIRLEEIQTMDAIINEKFHHNLVDVDLLRAEFKKLINDKENEYLDIEEPPFKLMKVESFTFGKKIYTKIITPIPDAGIYQLKKVYPILQPVNDNWSQVLELEAEWIASDSKNEKYMAWKEVNKECATIPWRNEATINICESNGITRSRKNIRCLLDQTLLGEPRKNGCNTKLVLTPNAWFVKLTEENSWLYMVKSEIKLKAICKLRTEAESIILKGAGILNILEPCDLTDEDTTIKFSKKITSELIQTSLVESPLILPEMPIWDSAWEINKNLTSLKDTKLKIDSHHAISDAIATAIKNTENLENEWKKEETIRNHQKQLWKVEQHGWLIWILVGITIFLTVIGTMALLWTVRNKLILNAAIRGLGNVTARQANHGTSTISLNRLTQQHVENLALPYPTATAASA